MKKTNPTRTLLAACSVVALSTVMYGCGSGGDAPPAVVAPEPAAVDLSGVTPGYMVTAGTYEIAAGEVTIVGDVTFSCAAGGADCTVTVAAGGMATYATDGGMVTAADSAGYRASRAALDIVRLYGEASGATTAATAAGAAAEQALENAQEYAGLLGATFVGGDSGIATANAQKVLDARDAAIQSVTDAEEAKTRAETAKTEAMALPDGTTGKTVLIAALDAAIETADEQLEAATDILDGTGAGTLAVHVAKVIGNDPDNPKTASDIGKDLAAGIADALDESYSFFGRTDLPNNIAVLTESNSTYSLPVMFDDRVGMTWAEIVGASNLVDKRISTGGDTTIVKALSVDGMPLAADEINPPGGVADGAMIEDGVQYPGTRSNGGSFTGVLFCAGTDCTAKDSKLVGSWYYTIQASDESKFYVRSSRGGFYEEETLYGRYGHWLQEAGGDVQVHAYGVTGANRENLEFDVIDGFPDKTATYEGGASGMSVHKTYDPMSGEVDSMASGPFTADVSLTMRFGTTPTLEGTVSGFDGSAVDPSWEVTLETADIDTFSSGSGDARTTTARFDGVTNNDPDGDVGEGTWEAITYGVRDQRPTGVVGSFDAHFPNGDVGGGYAARKQ